MYHTFINELLEKEKEIISKPNFLKELGKDIFSDKKIKIQLTNQELYHQEVVKWFLKIIQVMDEFSRIKIIIFNIHARNNNIDRVYDKIINVVKEYCILLSTYHDLPILVANSVQQLNIPNKELNWNKIKNVSDVSIIKELSKIFSLIEPRIKNRNSLLHEHNYAWFSELFTDGLIKLLSLIRIDDFKNILLPLSREVIIQINYEIKVLACIINREINALQIASNSYFDTVAIIYKSKISNLA